MLKLFTVADLDIPTAGTRVQLSATSTAVSSVTIQAHSSNTGAVYVGDSSVAAGRGIALTAGQVFALSADQSGRSGGEEFLLSDLYVDTATNGNDVKITYMKRA